MPARICHFTTLTPTRLLNLAWDSSLACWYVIPILLDVRVAIWVVSSDCGLLARFLAHLPEDEGGRAVWRGRIPM